MSLRASDTLEPADKATVHGIVIKLSPVKDSKRNEQKKYFECRLVNDKSIVRAVCFHKEQHGLCSLLVTSPRSLSFH